MSHILLVMTSLIIMGFHTNSFLTMNVTVTHLHISYIMLYSAAQSRFTQSSLDASAPYFVFGWPLKHSAQT